MTDNISIRICVNKIENRITFKTKIGYYLQFLMAEAMQLLQNTKSKINEDKNDANVSYLEITEVALAHYNVVNNDY